MIKFGITTIEQLLAEIDSPSRFVTKQVAIPLLSELDEQELPSTCREKILMELPDDRGAYKRTYRQRFEDFDASVCSLVREHVSDRPINVLDCGVSDAGTACDFYCQLEAEFKEVHYDATDYDPSVRVVQGNGLTLILSSRFQPMQVVYGRFVLNLTRPDRWITFPGNRFILEVLKRTKIRSLVRACKEGKSTTEELLLYCPDALELANRDRRFILGKADVRNPLPDDRYSIIRMMNVLNPEYFLDDEFRTILENVFNSLVEGGLFILGSNQDVGTAVNGGVFKKVKDRLVELYVAGSGPEVDCKRVSNRFGENSSFA